MKYLQIDSVIKPAFAAALSVLALAGCQKNGFETVYAGGDSIVSFAPSVAVTESTTKGALLNEDGTASAFPTGKTFKVSAWTGTTKSFGYDDVAYKTGGASGSYWITVYGSGPNQGKDKEYLWKQGETKSVFAYANLPTTSGAAGIENSSSASQVLTYDVSKVTTDDLQTDILMAYYTNGVTPKTDGLVPLTFYHPLTAVKFVQGTIAEGISIKSVSIEGVYPSGKTAQSSASSAFSWTKTDGTVFGTADETQTVSLSSVTVNPDTKQIGTALLLIPQAFSSSSKTRIKVVLKDAADASKTLTLYYPLNINLGTVSSPVYTSWVAGYTNTYKINFDGIVAVDRPEMYNGSPLEETVLPPDIIPGTFSVGPDKQVYFSKGNLYAKKDDGGNWTWHFYDKQYMSTSFAREINPLTPNQGSAAATDDEMDMFTFGYHVTKSVNPIGSNSDNVSITSGDLSQEQDWGSTIGDGKTWRTLTKAQWKYLIETRVVNGGKGNGKSYSINITYCGKKGLVLYPDGYYDSPLTSGADYSELPDGVVFLPMVGSRLGSMISQIGTEIGTFGGYWSSTATNTTPMQAAGLSIATGSVSVVDGFMRASGGNVRLVMDAEE